MNLSTGVVASAGAINFSTGAILDIGLSPDGEVWFLYTTQVGRSSGNLPINDVFVQKGATGTATRVATRQIHVTRGSLAVVDNTYAFVRVQTGLDSVSDPIYSLLRVNITRGTSTSQTSPNQVGLGVYALTYNAVDGKLYRAFSGQLSVATPTAQPVFSVLQSIPSEAYDTVAADGADFYYLDGKALRKATALGPYPSATLPDITTAAPATQTSIARWGARWWRRGVSGSLSGTLDSNILAITSKHIAFATATPSTKRPAVVLIDGVRHNLGAAVTARIGGVVTGSYNTKAFTTDLPDTARWDNILIIYEDGTASAMRQAVAGRRETFDSTVLPQGISFSPAARTIEIASNAQAGEHKLAARATDSASPANSTVALVTLTLTEPPTLTLPAVSNIAFVGGNAAHTQVLPEATGGDGTGIDYICDIPNTNNGNITFNSATRTLTVSPNTAAGTYTVTYEASDDNNTATQTFTITVTYNLSLTDPEDLVVHEDATRNIVLPAATGASAFTYSLVSVTNGVPQQNTADAPGIGFAAENTHTRD